MHLKSILLHTIKLSNRIIIHRLIFDRQTQTDQMNFTHFNALTMEEYYHKSSIMASFTESQRSDRAQYILCKG